MFVLGIDPGLTIAGYGVIEKRGPAFRAVSAGVIRTQRTESTPERLRELYGDLQALIAEYQPTEAAIEQVFVNKNLHTATAVGRASGVAMLALAEAGIAVSEYSPTAVKMALCGTGNAPKEQVKRVVAMRLGLDGTPEPADAADALAVALCHAQHAPMRSAVERAR